MEASAAGSYYNMRIKDRLNIIGATSPQESEAIKGARALPSTFFVVREILALVDGPGPGGTRSTS